MLILTRRDGESLKIGETVTIRILAVNGRQVRIGIDAPADIEIFREELLEYEEDPGDGQR
ncbi:carbon storage regulator CsrA [Ectothiorhodospira variabilis]|uniref:carbon storage regulator CsrA n=1 Tax=Ectothiorhodospira variabilis TaxID=505694 RepID=UPI001EFAC30F|nr:carbon storage regulator CsrA [Ectothiorhodospira variabilis]MCG5496038.1 carbon storage regulator CsrA [Ectothiorhodospira variabilis]MCG5504165.1 carbon storage regulator CsrA [Ectothiorhodospira variabilis]MCG5507320.1 carbon storage regulator CsrA [Ectothiorhodospira variabilis]